MSVFEFDWIFWINLLFLSCIAMSFGTSIYFLASSKLGPKQASAYIFLVPLISFNKDLYRIGFGGGYYDRTLAKLLNNKSRPKFFGISYDFQLTECKFESKFDVRLDKVITDKKVYV